MPKSERRFTIHSFHLKSFYFPLKHLFYFDSNAISKNPIGQYGLIAQAIKNFLQTKELRLDGDTLSICSERFDFFDTTKLIETLIADSFNIYTTNLNFVFLTRNQLKAKSNRENRVLRYIEVNDIIDYWKAQELNWLTKF